VGRAEIEDADVLGDLRVVAPLDVVVQQERPVRGGFAGRNALEQLLAAVDRVDRRPDAL
jgi:hypothetical protein